MKVKCVAINICEACLNGVGSECHTPGCALWLHRVDLPIDKGAYVVLEEYEEPDKPAPETDRCGGVSARIFTPEGGNI